MRTIHNDIMYTELRDGIWIEVDLKIEPNGAGETPTWESFLLKDRTPAELKEKYRWIAYNPDKWEGFIHTTFYEFGIDGFKNQVFIRYIGEREDIFMRRWSENSEPLIYRD